MFELITDLFEEVIVKIIWGGILYLGAAFRGLFNKHSFSKNLEKDFNGLIGLLIIFSVIIAFVLIL